MVDFVCCFLFSVEFGVICMVKVLIFCLEIGMVKIVCLICLILVNIEG